MIDLKDFKFPDIETRLIVFGESYIFKVKYNISSEGENIDHLFWKRGLIQSDIRRLTASILCQLVRTGNTVPIKTANIVVYPSTLPWPLSDSLYFSYKGKQLKAHPQVILLLIHPLSDSSNTTSHHESQLGKRKNGGDLVSEFMLADTGVPSSDVLQRKKLKLNSETQAIIPSGAHVGLPCGSTTISLSPSPTPALMAELASEIKHRLHTLSQPSSDQPLEEEEERKSKRRDSGLWRSMKNLLGWK